MKHCLLILLCMVSGLSGTTNEVTTDVNNNTIDKINTHMKDNYNLPIKKNGKVILTGYTVQDSFSRLVNTYSVLHIDF